MGPLVSTEWLGNHLDRPEMVVVDARWKHGQPGWGRDAYTECRIRGAVYLDLDDDLSDRSDLSRGRHPLPEPGRFVEALAAVGIGRGSTVIAYDDAAGAVAARLWWMLRWIGHADAAVLDGGLDGWSAGGRPIERGPSVPPTRHRNPLDPRTDDSMVLATPESVGEALMSGVVLLDARSPERFRGEQEPIDKFAGRITGARNAPFSENLAGEDVKVFRPADALRLHYEELGIGPETQVACYCGSGVTACHDILALVLAGYAMPRLYPGSWSEWCEDPTLPTSIGGDD